jgi:hypothetical protein
MGIRCPDWGIAADADEAVVVADRVGYPVLVRPSYVLGGRSMRICYDGDEVRAAMAHVEGAVLLDRFLENAIELDVDALCDGEECYVAGVMEHVEEAGVHSGDSSCVLPAPSDSVAVRRIARELGRALGVVGLLNVQLAIDGRDIYVLEVNPRASRTIPFVSKATGVNVVDVACRLMAGARVRELGLPDDEAAKTSLADLQLPPERLPIEFHVKAAVLPFARFAGADPVLGPEMRSTGEVMASARDFATAFAKAERAANRTLPGKGSAFLSVRDQDKLAIVPIARALARLGFDLVATAGTASALTVAGIDVELVEKGPSVLELIRSGRADLIINTPEGRNARRDGYAIREAAVIARVPCITTLPVARAAVAAIARGQMDAPVSLQEHHASEFVDAPPAQDDGPVQHLLVLNDDGSVSHVAATAGPDGLLHVSADDLPALLAEELQAVLVASSLRDESVTEDLSGEFEELLNSDRVHERDIQEFLEANPEFLLGADYDLALPQVVLPIGYGESLRPDFILRPMAGVSWDAAVVELKLPGQRLVRRRPRHHPPPYDAVTRGVEQLRRYQRFFEEEINRTAFASNAGFTIHRPRLALVVGRAADFPDKEALSTTLRGIWPVDVLSYDDLILRYRRIHAVRRGHPEAHVEARAS